MTELFNAGELDRLIPGLTLPAFDEAMEKRANALAEMAESKIQSLMCDQLHLRAAEVFFLEVFSDV